MNGMSVSAAAEMTIESMPMRVDGKPSVPPEVRSDNTSCYFSKEIQGVMTETRLRHYQAHQDWPEENGLIEWANRTAREGLKGEGRAGRHAGGLGTDPNCVVV